MNKIKSIYLDLLRIISAFYVFLYHFVSYKNGKIFVFSNNAFSNFLNLKYIPAHYFVIVFFVLSGYLITMSASRPNVTLKKFMVARLGRLYSVLIPSLLFSYLVYFYLSHFTKHTLHLNEHSNFLLTRFFVNLLFLSQCWSLSSTPPINNPFWSVDYEFIYYIILASLLLIKGSNKYIALFICIAIAGFKILLLAPCWLLGSLLYKIDSRKEYLNNKLSLIIFTISSVLIILVVSGLYILPFTKIPGDQIFLENILYFSWNFRADYIFALLIIFNLHSVFGLSRFLDHFSNNRFIIIIYPKIQLVSNCTYTLYLFHLPLLLLFSSFGFYDHTNNFSLITLILAVLMAVYLIAKQTEFKVNLWRGWLEKIFVPIDNIFLKARKNLLNY